MQLAVSELLLDWQLGGGSPDIVQLPKELPPLFAGERLIIYALTSSDKTVLDGRVILRGKIGEHVLEFRLDVDSGKNISSKDESLPIHRLAAKAQIKQLQDAGKDENKMAIVLLSMAANVISCHTSMVGVDKECKEKVIGDLIRQNVPAMYDAPMMMACSGFAAPRMMMRCAPQPEMAMGGPPPFPLAAKACAYSAPPSYSMMGGGSGEVIETQPPAQSTYLDIVSLQKFSGEWKLDEDLAKVLKTTLDALEKASPVKALTVWATVLALSYLEAKYCDKKDEWEMIDMKARQWLDLQDCEGHSIDDLLKNARSIVDQA